MISKKEVKAKFENGEYSRAFVNSDGFVILEISHEIEEFAVGFIPRTDNTKTFFKRQVNYLLDDESTPYFQRGSVKYNLNEFISVQL